MDVPAFAFSAIAGQLEVISGTLVFDTAPAMVGTLVISNGTLLADSAITVSGAMLQSGGGMSGTGTLTVQGLFSWTGGSQFGTGETIASGDTELSGSNQKNLDARTLTLDGNTTYSGSGNIRVANGATLNNNGTFDIQNDTKFDSPGGLLPTFNNTTTGTLTKTAGSGTTDIEMNINNSGAVLVNSGTLRLGESSAVGSSDGSFVVTSGTTLQLKGNQEMLASSSLSGAGDMVFLGGGNTRIEGIYAIAGQLEVISGTLVFDTAPAMVGTLVISNGTLLADSAITVSGAMLQSGGGMSGTGTLTVQGLFSWTGGSQFGTGETIASGDTELSGSNQKNLDARTLTLDGNTTYSGSGNIRVANGATLNNNGAFDIQNDSKFDSPGGLIPTFNNNSTGTLTKTAGSGTTDIEMNFNNSGAISSDTGAMRITQNFTQDGNGTLNISIASGVFDSYAISKAASLDGTLAISLVEGYEPLQGESFQIMTFNSLAGTFSTITGDIIGNGNKFVLVYGNTDVTLDVVAE